MTADVLSAMDIAARVVRDNGLHLSVVEFSPGSATSHRWDRETRTFTKPVLPEIRLIMFSRPDEFMRWADHLSADRVTVHRREMDTCLRVTVDRDGFTWSAHSSIRRPDSGPHLPGIAVAWVRQRSGRPGNDALITRIELRAALTELGVFGPVAP